MSQGEKVVLQVEYTPWRIQMRQRVAERLIRCAFGDTDRWDAEAARALLDGRLHGDSRDVWVDAVDQFPPVPPAQPAHEEPEWGALDQSVPSARRKRWGVYFTPTELARRAAEQALPAERVLDLAAGDGSLLSAVGRFVPDTKLFAIEQDLDLAAACAVRGLVEGLDLEVWCTDGLGDLGPKAVDAIVMNPPYLGEKGNAEFFDELRRTHPHLEPAMVARGDLANLFLYRALQRLEDGGRLVAITSEYWLQSDAARPVRELIRGAFAVRRLERFGAGRFADAPGHHTLLTVIEAAEQGGFQTCVVDGGGAGDVVREHPGEVLDSDRWNPFAPDADKEGVPLGEIVSTAQGFVSGADRLTKRHLSRFAIVGKVGAPIFLFDERPDSPVGARLEPVLRGSQLAAGEVIESFDPVCWALYIDGELPEDDPARAHLEVFRPILEHRREAKNGSMPWYRMHWPRDRVAMSRPKLVCPRRAERPTFALDLTGSLVSSDCTWIVAPDDVTDEVAFLKRLMHDLNSSASHRWLRRHGKVKGAMLEFYAGPLEALPVDRSLSFSTG